MRPYPNADRARHQLHRTAGHPAIEAAPSPIIAAVHQAARAHQAAADTMVRVVLDRAGMAVALNRAIARAGSPVAPGKADR